MMQVTKPTKILRLIPVYLRRSLRVLFATAASSSSYRCYIVYPVIDNEVGFPESGLDSFLTRGSKRTPAQPGSSGRRSHNHFPEI
jgi:hypothetical protein